MLSFAPLGLAVLSIDCVRFPIWLHAKHVPQPPGISEGGGVYLLRDFLFSVCTFHPFPDDFLIFFLHNVGLSAGRPVFRMLGVY